MLRHKHLSRYSKIRAKLGEQGFDLLETKKVIQKISKKVEFFTVGKHLFIDFRFDEKIESSCIFEDEIDDYIIFYRNGKH